MQPLFLEFLHKDQVTTDKKMEEFFEKMTSRGTPVKYLLCNNTGEHQLKLQRACEKRKGYVGIHDTAHTPAEQLELVMSVHVDDVFMAVNLETIKVIK